MSEFEKHIIGTIETYAMRLRLVWDPYNDIWFEGQFGPGADSKPRKVNFIPRGPKGLRNLAAQFNKLADDWDKFDQLIEDYEAGISEDEDLDSPAFHKILHKKTIAFLRKNGLKLPTWKEEEEKRAKEAAKKLRKSARNKLKAAGLTKEERTALGLR